MMTEIIQSWFEVQTLRNLVNCIKKPDIFNKKEFKPYCVHYQIQNQNYEEGKGKQLTHYHSQLEHTVNG